MSERIEKSYFSGNPKGDGQPYPKIPNRAAQALGRLAAGKPKHFSKKEIQLRKARLVEARKIKMQKYLDNKTLKDIYQ